MNKTEFINWLSNDCNLEQNQIELILKYKDFLQQRNLITNLTRLSDESIVYDSYFVESILPFIKINFNPKNNESLLDIGSGSGIPGVLIKIFYPQLNVILIESNNKKATFLNDLINHLQLKNISVINDRCEEFIKQKDMYEKFDYVTSRAVSSLNCILELSVGFTKVNGIIIQPKSVMFESELINAKHIISELDLSMTNKIEYIYNNKTNVVVCFKKNSITNRIYPRSWAKIKKDENSNHH